MGECEHCRLKVQMRRERSSSGPPEQPRQADEELLADVLSGIRRWEADRTRPDRSGDAVKRRVAYEVGPYLGPQATQRLLESVSAEGENLWSTVEPVLALFLGSRAASTLVTHVIDQAIVRA